MKTIKMMSNAFVLAAAAALVFVSVASAGDSLQLNSTSDAQLATARAPVTVTQAADRRVAGTRVADTHSVDARQVTAESARTKDSRAQAADATQSKAEAERGRRALVGADDQWESRTVWACDHRKMVVVEGVRPGEKIPPDRAQLVAEVLMDLMRFCNEEITAKIGVDQQITVAANGRVYEHYVVGGDLPILPASFGQPTAREKLIWKAELDKLVAEGDRLFHSDELGTNGVACAMCHPHASNTHPETYPKFQTQLKKVALVRDMVNWCIENPLEGKVLEENDPRMKALEAYILAQRAGKKLEVGKH